MKKLLLKSVFVIVLTLAVISTVSVAFADGASDVLFSVIDENITLESATVPLKKEFEAFIAEDNPGFNIYARNDEKYAGIDPQMPAIGIASWNNSDYDGTVGIDFKRNISPEIFKDGTDNVFLTFYYCNVNMLIDLDLIEIGSLYRDGDKLLRRDPVKLSKYTDIQTKGFQKLEFSMADLGITSPEDELHGLYFTMYTNTLGHSAILAKIDKLNFVKSVGKTDLSDNAKIEPVYVLKSNVLDKASLPVEMLETENFKPLSTLLCKYSLSDKLGFTGYRIYEAYKPKGRVQKVFPTKTKNTVRSFDSLGLTGLENYCLKFDIAKCEGFSDASDLKVGAGFCIKGPTFSKSTALIKYVDIKDYIDISEIPNEKTKKNKDGGYITVSVPLKDIMKKTGIVNINDSYADEITYKNLSCIAFELEASGHKNLTPLINIDNICFELQGTPEIDNEYANGIKWTNNSANYLCYTIVKDGVKLCDTTISEIKNLEPGNYRIYTYIGNGVYSSYAEVKID